ncbi:MAG: PBS lyase [Leptolyngbya sp. ERB_1_1]
MIRSRLLIVTCFITSAACLNPSTRSVEAVQPQSLPLAQSGQQAKTPFWAAPLFLGSIGATSIVGAVTILVLKRSSRSTPEILEPITSDLVLAPKRSNGASHSVSKPDSPAYKGYTRTEAEALETQLQVVEPPTPPPLEETTRLAKVNIVDELMQDLRTSDPMQRRKAIWELGQRGDTRAVQPLVDLLIDSDSKQQSLILSALSEIGTRTLKPMTRALAISLQDENAEVRKNAIRDLTRVYDLVSQISHLLHQATEDSDQDVQETAKWALGRLNRIRSTSGETLPTLENSVNSSERPS